MAQPGSSRWPLVAVVLLGLALVGVLAINEKDLPKINVPYRDAGGDFSLMSAKGKVSLADFRGKLVVLYFGYTSCPDICPTSLGALAQALKQLSADEVAQIQPIFISVDPERDTPDKLAEYAAYFFPSIIGLTGSAAQIKDVAGRYGAFYKKADLGGSSMSYAIDHSSTLYLVDKDGKLVSTIQHSDSPAAILDEMKKFLGK